jgi:membrane protease YdiL (CAAX protease family)
MEKSGAISPLAAVLAVVASFFLVEFLGGAAFLLVGYPIVQAIAELLVLVIPLGYMLYKRVNIKNFIAFDTKPFNILLGISIGAVLFLFDVFTTSGLTLVFGTSAAVQESNNLITNASRSSPSLIVVIVSLLLAGICEEFTFRGFLQTAINNKYPFWIALLASSVAFGFFHFDPQAVYTIGAFLMGLLLGYIYHHWHSYATNVAAHATIDLITLAILVLVK